MAKKAVYLSEESHKLVEALAKTRGLEIGDAGDHLVKVGNTRINALANYAAGQKKPAKKAKPKAKKSAPAKKKPAGKKKTKDPEASKTEAKEPWPDTEAGDLLDGDGSNCPAEPLDTE